MLRVIRLVLIGVICFCSIAGAVQAKDLKVSLAYPLVPLVESKDKGILIDLLKAMAEEYKDGKITWDVFPFARSVENVKKGRADLHLPYTVRHNPQKMDAQYSTEMLLKVVIALYTNKNNREINPKNLTRYKVETDEGVKYMLESSLPNIMGSPSIESSLQKVNIGRIDAWIFAMRESDVVLKRLRLTNIKRWEYEKNDVKALLPDGEKGKEVDKIFSGLIKKLKANGKYQKIMGPLLNAKFDDWQV